MIGWSWIMGAGAMNGAVRKDATVSDGRIVPFGDVVLRESLSVEGENVPQGATGTVVEMLPDGIGCIVEFFEPRHCVVTVDRRRLGPASG
jgi:hypothetical protein